MAKYEAQTFHIYLQWYTLIAESIIDMLEAAKYYHETIIPDMEEIRVIADLTEGYLPDDVLPYPNYEQLLFSI